MLRQFQQALAYPALSDASYRPCNSRQNDLEHSLYAASLTGVLINLRTHLLVDLAEGNSILHFNRLPPAVQLSTLSLYEHVTTTCTSPSPPVSNSDDVGISPLKVRPRGSWRNFMYHVHLKGSRIVSLTMWRIVLSRSVRLVAPQLRECRQALCYQPPFANEPSDYKEMQRSKAKVLNERLTDPNRFQRISEREDRSDWPADACKAQIKGRNLCHYRGCDISKCPEDFLLLHQLFSYVKPATVIELGSYVGGSAIWIADTLKLLDIPCQIYSMEKDISLLADRAKELKPDNVTFLQGDSFAIEKTFTPELLSKLPHPWVIDEDAHANKPGVLRYFHDFLKEGDYIVFEDTNPNMALKLGMGGVVDYGSYEIMGPKQLNALKGFLQEYEEYYAVDSFFTDLFGYNGSWHWHGFIRRMK